MRKGGIADKSFFFLLLCAGLALALSVSVMAAARRGRTYDPAGGGMTGQSAADLRRLEMEQQAQQSAGLIDRALDDFFNQINQCRDPGELYVTSAAVLLEETRRQMAYFSDSQKGRYFLLQSWVEYCGGDVDQANMSSARACRMDGTYRDAWISQQYFAMLGGKRPLQPRPPRPQTSRRGEMAGMDMAADYGTGQPLFGTTGKLDFDPESLRYDLVGRSIEPFTAAFLDGTACVFEYDKEVLCLLVREIPAEEMEEKPQTETGQPLLYTTSPQAAPAAATYDYVDYGGQPAGGDNADPQLAVIELLRDQAAGSGGIRFFTVITNKSVPAETLAAYLAEQNPSLPQLPAATTVKELAVDAETAFALVVDKAGQYRFAGSARGFLLPLLLSKITGISFTGQSRTGQAAWMEGMDYGMGTERPAGDPNAPAVAGDPNAPAEMRRPPAGRPQPQAQAPRSREMMQDLQDAERPPVERVPTQEMTHENLCGAAQLQAARDFFMQAAGRKFITYRKGVDLCRYVMKNCPNSENAKAARQLLRESVPEDQRERYGLTREELGL